MKIENYKKISYILLFLLFIPFYSFGFVYPKSIELVKILVTHFYLLLLILFSEFVYFMQFSENKKIKNIIFVIVTNLIAFLIKVFLFYFLNYLTEAIFDFYSKIKLFFNEYFLLFVAGLQGFLIFVILDLLLLKLFSILFKINIPLKKLLVFILIMNLIVFLILVFINFMKIYHQN